MLAFGEAKREVRDADIRITLEPATAEQWKSARPVGELQLVDKTPVPDVL